MPFFSAFFSNIANIFVRFLPFLKPTSWLAAREAWSLATSGYAGEPRLYLLKQQFRWAAAASIKPEATLNWFKDLHGPALSMYAGLNPRLVFKPLRVYMSSKWEIEQKIKTIADTYRFIHRFGAPLQNALIRVEGTKLAHISITGEYDAHIILGYNNRYRKEGELVASLWCAEQGGFIVSTVFSFEQQHDGTWAMYVGCVQGDGRNDNKPLTKAMHGLRPKAFMVFIVQEIAAALGVTYIYGVGNDIHSHQKKHILYIPSRHGLSFDYDSLWEEAGGKTSVDGWFAIPLQFQRRPHESIKANKRSMYLRRYTMLDNVSEQIRASLLSGDELSGEVFQ